MRVQSFMRQGRDLVPVQVELTLAPGLPLIRFIGLPDAAVRESAPRIRTAIRKQGFELPKGRQILVHLKPNHLRKTSRGLDLAVAAALLWETGQLVKPGRVEDAFLYGELSLTGEVETPDDIEDIPSLKGAVLFSGERPARIPVPVFRLKELRDLGRPLLLKEPAFGDEKLIPPKPTIEHLHTEAAFIASVVAAGEHNAIFAGPAGSGKTTLADAIPAWIEAPAGDDLQIARRWAKERKSPLWRPVMKPHHTITKTAMVGGGASVWAGEITRAHSVVLILDELLEFDSDLQEALREPVETGIVSIARVGRSEVFPARILLLATTNLCQCGHFVPGADASESCRCSNTVRERYLQRLAGPFLDRFAVFVYTNRWRERGEKVTVGEVRNRVQAAIQFRREMRGQLEPNSRIAIAGLACAAQVQDYLDQELENASFRRRESVLRVARTIADLRASRIVEVVDLERAIQIAYEGHQRLENWRG